MKKGIIDPISLLKEYITGKKQIKISDNSLSFGSIKLPLSTETGDLWLYLDCNVVHENPTTSRYLPEIVKYGLQKINPFDEDEIVKYFTGKIEDSEAINQELKATLKIGANDKKKTQEKKNESQDPLIKKKSKNDEEFKGDGEDSLIKNESVSKEKENIKIMEMLSRIEKVIDSKNRMLRRQHKSFKAVLDQLILQETRELEKTVLPTQAPSQQVNQSSQSSSMNTVQPSQIKKPSTKLEEVLMSGGQLNATNPIILVFPQPSAGTLSFNNAKEFLLNGEYVDASKIKGTESVKNKITIPKDIKGKKVLFDIMSDTTTIKKENLWPRVVAVFLNGHTYQFQGWPEGDKIATFLSKKRGYFMRFHDMPTPDNIKNWNVKMLERFMDPTTKNQFWEDLEAFLMKPAR